MIVQSFLSDTEFLKKLTLQRTKTIYARIISLTIDGAPVEAIEGRVTGGSLNIDGAAAIRRSCSLTLVGQDLKITDYYWALKSRFSLEIGVLNEIDPQYPDICWFKQGIFVVNSFSKSHNLTQVQISISGQDKMCLLNGTLGGALGSEVNFGEVDKWIDEETMVTEKIPIKDILYYALQTFAREPLQNIVINDLDLVNGWDLWNYRGDTDLYYLYKTVSSGGNETLTLANFSINEEDVVEFKDRNNTDEAIGEFTQLWNALGKLESADGSKKLMLKDLSYFADNNDKNINPFYTTGSITGNANLGFVFNKGNTTYRITRVRYGEDAGYHPTELVYPSDLILAAGSPLTQLFDKIKQMLGAYEYFYDVDGRFIFQKQKTYTQGLFSPIVGQNSYVVPATTLSQYSYVFDDATLVSAFSNNMNVTDIKNDFSIWGTRKGVAGNNNIPIHGRFAVMKKPTRYKTYNNQIYRSVYNSSEKNAIIVDWREILYQMAYDEFNNKDEADFRNKLVANNPEYYKGITGYEPFYIDILGFWRDIYDPNNGVAGDITSHYKIHYLDASSLNFWIDFMEPHGQLAEISNEKIGNRTKVESKGQVKSMWYSETPEVQIVPYGENTAPAGTTTYKTLNIPKNNNLENCFVISSRGTSVFDKADELFNKHILTAQSATITALPIYYLQPNTLIYVKDPESGLEGDYIMSKFSLPLTYNGTMSITATKVIDQFA